MTKIIVVAVLILSVAAGFLFWAYTSKSISIPTKQNSGSVVLQLWGFEDKTQIDPILNEYESLNPNVQIVYTQQSLINYRSRVQTQIREGNGPDIFPIHNSWLSMFKADLAPAPAEVFNSGDYQTAFVQVANDSFMKDNQIYAVPLTLDGLALFINTDILSAAGLSAPRTWNEFTDDAAKMTVRDSKGQIKTAGAALGTTTNVDYWSDILGLLLLQEPGVDLTSPASDATGEVLTFYTNFVTNPKQKTWDLNLASSTQQFIQGNLAFYFAPSAMVKQIQMQNPNIKFSVVPVPQLPNSHVAWASFYGAAVARTSKNQVEAWKFAKFLASKVQEAQQALATDPHYGAFSNQGPYYKFWYLASNTNDSGINDEMIGLWQNGVNAVLSGQSPQSVLQDIASKESPVLDKYK